MIVKTELVTPDIAVKMLEQNKNNRKINRGQVDLLVRTMKAGGWKLTHQGIAVYEDGTIADGQHRLLAIVESGVTCRLSVAYDLNKNQDVMLAMDSGRQRTVADSISLSGDKITSIMVTIAKGLEFGYTTGATGKITHQETAALCVKYSESLSLSGAILSAKQKGVSIAPVKVAILEAITDGVSEEIAKEFYHTLITGEYDQAIYRNAIKLRNRLMCENHNGGSYRPTAHAMAYNALISTAKDKIVNRLNKVIQHRVKL